MEATATPNSGDIQPQQLRESPKLDGQHSPSLDKLTPEQRAWLDRKDNFGRLKLWEEHRVQ